MSQSWHLNGYDRDIRNATQAIGRAHTPSERAAGYVRRGRAYSDKARYCWFFHLISPAEYGRQFQLALQDHSQALALDASNAEVHFGRGQSYFDRATLEGLGDSQPWLALAAADFQKAAQLDSRHDQAWDMLGLVHVRAGDLDQAIADFTREMKLNSLGRLRLAETYCERGSVHQKQNRPDLAIADYRSSIATGADPDSCSCDPYNPLLALYTQGANYDPAWEIVHQAQKDHRWLAPELLQDLRDHSSRSH